MSLKLDELRKRLLQQPPPQMSSREPHRASANRVAAAPEGLFSRTPEPPAPRFSEWPAAEDDEANEPAESNSQPEPEASAKVEDCAGPATAAQQSHKVPPGPTKSDVPQCQFQDSVAKVFEGAKTFEGRFDELTRTLGQIEQVAAAAASVFAPLQTFHDQLAHLAVSLEPLRAFQAQLAQMAQTFEPMKVLHDQVAQLANSFQPHLAQLVAMLNPAREFRERILALARTFEQLGEIQAGFTELSFPFHSSELDGARKVINGLDTQATSPH
jgi:hypothetical protein